MNAWSCDLVPSNLSGLGIFSWFVCCWTWAEASVIIRLRLAMVVSWAAIRFCSCVTTARAVVSAARASSHSVYSSAMVGS